MLRHALASFYPGGARGGGARAAAQRGRAGSPQRCRQLQEAGATNFTIFLRGAPIGSEQIAVNRVASGWTIVSSGRLGAPLDVVARRLQVRYTADWKPIEFTLDGTIARAGADDSHRRRRHDGEERRHAPPVSRSQKTDTIDPRALLLLPTNFFGPYEALAARLKTAAAGSEIPAYSCRRLSITIAVGESSAEQIQTTGAPGRRAAHAHRAGAARRTPRRRPLDRRRRPDDPLQRAAAVARGRARGHRRGLVAQRRRSRGRTTQQVNIPEQRLLARRHAVAAGADQRRAAAGGRAGRRQRADRSRQSRRRHSDPRPDRRRARRRRLHRRPLRQARHRPERRPRRSGQRSPTTPTMCAPR